MYAKDYFRNNKIISDPGLCFILMPFASQFDEVWRAVRDVVSGAPFNLICRRADDISQPGQIMSDVLKNIGQANLVIADLSGQNPNVFYELGIAHTIKDNEQVILLAGDRNDIPFDLRHLRCIVYDGDLQKLTSSLASSINEIGIKQYSIILSKGQTGTFPPLTGDDNDIFEINVSLEILGEDGAKFMMNLIKLEAGKPPDVIHSAQYYLGEKRSAIEVPNLLWSMCYSRLSNDEVRFILGRAPGWQP